MSRITRELTPRTTMDALRKQAKRWLKDIEAGGPDAVQRFRDVYPGDSPPKLREVQHALSQEFGFASWASLKEALQHRAQSHADRVQLFLEKGVHRYGTNPVTRKWGEYERDGDYRGALAARLLAKYPEIARENIHTAVLAHDVDLVREFLAKDPALASSEHPYDGWRPLMRLAYARLPLPAMSHALTIATMLMDAGADPSGHLAGYVGAFRATTGAIGGGEAGQSPHPQAEAFTRLLISRGADPLDGQALYNTSLGGDDTFWLDLMWSESMKRGDDVKRWHTEIPETLGPPLEYLLGNAVPNHPRRVAWLLEHGADANTSNHYSKIPVIRHAAMAGQTQIVELLVRHGAQAPTLSEGEMFLAAVRQGDLVEIRRLAQAHPAFLQSFHVMSAAINSHRTNVVEALLDLGMSPDIGDDKNFRALHLATHAGAQDIARLLITRGAEIDPFENRYGGTPLSHASYQGRQEMIDIIAPHSHNIRGLCFAGCIDRLRDLFAENPVLASAPIHEHEPPLFCLPDDDDKAVELVELLLSFGAKTDVRNAEGLTPGEAARKRGLEDAAALLDP